MDRVDVTIIGGGPVGLFAAFYAGMRGMSARIIDSLPELGGQLMALYPEKPIFDMPGFPNVMAKSLAADMAEQGTRFGANIQLNVQADTLTKDEDGWMITSADGVEYPTKTLIIAAGAGAFSPTQMRAEREDEFNGKGLGYGVREIEAFRDKDVPSCWRR